MFVALKGEAMVCSLISLVKDIFQLVQKICTPEGVVPDLEGRSSS